MANKFLTGIKVFGDINVKNGKLNFPNSSIADGKNGIYINNKIDGQNDIETGISLVSNGVAEYIDSDSHNVFSKTVGLPKCIINDIVYFDGKYIAATFSWTNQAYGIYYSYDGQHWQPSTLSTGRIQRLCVCDTEHGQILLAAYFAKGFKASKDGINWTTTNTADTTFDVSGKWGSVAFGNGLIVAGDDNAVYDGTTGTYTFDKENALVYSTLTSTADGTFNAGAWTRVNVDGKGIHEVTFINNTWFVGTTDGLYITSSPNATFSTWIKVLAGSSIYSIIFSEEANAYFIGTGDCVFKSTDLQSFTEVCGAADIVASGLVARTLACHDKFVIVGTEDGLQGLISDNYGEAGSWKRFAGFDENSIRANYRRIKFINGTFFLGNGSDADMDRCPESPIVFFDIDKVIATTADVERATKLTFAAFEQVEKVKSGLEDSITEVVATKADISNVYTKSEIDLQNTAFLKKESDGIQTVSSDLALTGYVLIDNLSIDQLEIESLTASSNVTLSGGLTVTNGLVADSISIGNDAVALAKNIPGIATSSIAGIAKYDGKGVAIESDGTVNLKLRTNHSGVEFENGGLYVQTSTADHPTTGTVAPVATDTAGKLVVPDATSSAKGGVKLATNLDDTGAVSVTTASQVKTALAGKANSTHSHTTSEVNGLSEVIAIAIENKADKATTLAGYGITDSYTKAEIDSKNVEFLKKESSGIQTVSSDLALTGYVLIDNLAIDELEIESLSAKSMVTLGGGLTVNGGITVDDKEVATKSDISDFITKDVSNLTNYETKSTAEGKYALASSLSNYALKTDISNVYKYVGSVDTYSALPTTGQKVGDVYNIVNVDETNNISAGDNVAWTGTAWDKLGGSVDLSNYVENGSDADLKSVAVSKSSAGKNLVLTAYDDNTVYLGLLDTLPPNENTIPTTLMSFSEGNVGILAPELIQLNSEQLINIQTTVGGVSIIGFDGVYLEHSDGNNINTLELTNSSSAKLYSNKGITIQSDSIKLSGHSINGSRPTYNDSPLALTSDIPDISSFITKDVSDLTNYETKTVAEGKYAQKSTTLSGYGITDSYTKTEVNNLVDAKADASSVYTKSEIDLKDTAFLTKESTGIQTVSSDLALTGYVLIDNLSIDELEIESLTASSLVTLSGGLNVSGGLVADSIKVGSDDVALAKNIPDVSNFVSKSSTETQSIVGPITFCPNTYGNEGISFGKVDLYQTGNSGNSCEIFLKLSKPSAYGDSFPDYLQLGTSEIELGIWKNVNGEPTNINATVSFPEKSGTLALTSDITSSLSNYETKTVAEGKYAQKSTTLSGYGITDAYTKSEADSKFITKDVSNLTNYETKTVAEGKYALKEEIPEVPTSAKYEIPAKTQTNNKIIWTITLDEEPDVAPIMQVFNKNGDVVYANITYTAGVITVVINSSSDCAEGDYYIIVSGQTGNSGYRTKVISNADFAQAALDNKIDSNTIYYIV